MVFVSEKRLEDREMRWVGDGMWMWCCMVCLMLLWCSEVSSLQMPASSLMRRIQYHPAPRISPFKPSLLPRHGWRIHAHSGDTTDGEKEEHNHVNIAEPANTQRNISRIDWTDINAWKKLTLDEAMDQLVLMPTEEMENLSEDIREIIEQKLDENGPSFLERTKNLLGITPLTIAGFLLAFFLLACNQIFGSGWASRMLGWNDEIDLTDPETKVMLKRDMVTDPEYRSMIEKENGNLNVDLDEILRQVRESRMKEELDE